VSQQLVSAVVLGSIYTLFALGLTLSWGVLNVLNLAHGAVFMTGALIAYRVTRDRAVPIYAVLPAAMLVTGAVSVALQQLVYAPIRRRIPDAHGAELGMLIASVGVAAIPVAVAVELTGNQSVALANPILTVRSYDVLGVRVTNIELLIVAGALTMSAALAWFVRASRHGRALRALAFDPEACGLFGISATRAAVITMFVSGALAGAAGVMLSVQLNAVEAHMGDPLLMKAFAVIILGGVGSMGGTIAAAFLLALVETGVVVYVGAGSKDLVAFALIMVLLLLRPEGLFSRTAWQRS
jgi:branched-chain amino acid transport system permease protein